MIDSSQYVSPSLPARLEKRLQRRGLRVILGGSTNGDATRKKCFPDMNTVAPDMNTVANELDQGQDGILALGTLEAQLKGEHWFLEQVRATIRTTIGIDDGAIPEADFKTLLTKNGHDNLIHIAQFYLFLNALKCETPDQIEVFIESHNQKVQTELSREGAVMRAGALKKRQFSVNDITQIRMTVNYYGTPVFAVTELGYFLSDLMSPATTTNLVKELVRGGVFEQIAGPPLEGGDDSYREKDAGPMTTDPRRKLIHPKPQFLRDYQTSLLMARQQILATG